MIVEEKKVAAGEDRRMFERVAMRMPVAYQLGDKSEQGEASSVNISASGMEAFTDRNIKPDQRLRLWLKFRHGHTPCYTQGRVIWCVQAREFLWKIGIEFDEPNLTKFSRMFVNR
jgi:hypothetical protein